MVFGNDFMGDEFELILKKYVCELVDCFEWGYFQQVV